MLWMLRWSHDGHPWPSGRLEQGEREAVLGRCWTVTASLCSLSIKTGPDLSSDLSFRLKEIPRSLKIPCTDPRHCSYFAASQKFCFVIPRTAPIRRNSVCEIFHNWDKHIPRSNMWELLVWGFSCFTNKNLICQPIIDALDGVSVTVKWDTF